MVTANVVASFRKKFMKIWRERKNPFPHRNNGIPWCKTCDPDEASLFIKKMCSLFYSSRARLLIYSVCVIFSVCSIFQNIQMDSNAFVFRFPFFFFCTLQFTMRTPAHIHISGRLCHHALLILWTKNNENEPTAFLGLLFRDGWLLRLCIAIQQLSFNWQCVRKCKG